jgi:predicted AAA+ superfamily ATPase
MNKFKKHEPDQNNYTPRIIDNILQQYLEIFGSVLIKGPKWCGKTWLAKKSSKSVYEVADPTDNFRNRQLAIYDVNIVLEGENPHLIDEWQEVPNIWDAVRYKTDITKSPGLFILTGSSSPENNSTIHTGAGRFGILKMTTMTMRELGISKGLIDIQNLFKEDKYNEYSGQVGQFSIDNIINHIVIGGWPALIPSNKKTSLKQAEISIKSYLDIIVNEDISRVDGKNREPQKVRALLCSLARNTATLVNRRTLELDIQDHNQSISENTISDYLNVLRKIFILEEIEPWYPALKSKIRVRGTKKLMLADTSLAVSILGADPESLKNDLKFLGNLFESTIIHDLSVYATMIDAQIKHYHDNTDLEIDIIVEKRNGSYGAIEVKLGYQQIDDAIKNLNRFKKKLIKDGQTPPSFLAVVVGIGSFFHIVDGVYIIPADLL